MTQTQLQPSVEQMRAIEGKEKHKQIIAGPGTGKTKLLEYAVQHLLRKGSSADSILVLAYSKTDANNMADRLDKKLGIKDVQCSTNHAFGLKIIMKYWQEIGFAKKPTVKTKAAWARQNAVLKNATKGLRNKADKTAVKKAVRQALKNPKLLRTANENAQVEKRINQVIVACECILSKRKAQNWVTYDDMIDLPLQLFQQRPDILRQVAQDVRHVLVDEAQDISMQEAQFIYLLAKNAQSSMIVGDPKQSIYGFRGATPECLEKLHNKLDATTYHLTASFRLPKQVLRLVNAVGSDINDDPHLTSQLSGYQARFVKLDNTDDQAKFLEAKIRMLLDHGVHPSEIAILGRRWRSLALLKNTPVFAELPIDQSFKRSKDTPDLVLLALIRITKWWAMKPKRGDHPFTLPKSLRRVLKYCGLSKKRRRDVIRQVIEGGWDKLKVPTKWGKPLNRNITGIRKAVKTAATLSPESGVQLLIDAIKSNIKNHLKNDGLRILSEWGKIKVQLREYENWSSVTSKSLKLPVYHESGIEMLSVNAAKGSEWSYVFLIDFVNSEFPLYFHKDHLDMDQERRLFYVALTRTKKKLTIIQSPVYREHFNGGKNRNKKDSNLLNKPSVFTKRYRSKMKVVSSNA